MPDTFDETLLARCVAAAVAPERILELLQQRALLGGEFDWSLNGHAAKQIALFPATSEREKISFHQLNKKTGHRIKYRKVDAESGDEVDSADIIKGYEVGKGDYIEIDPEELEAVAIESKRTIDIDEFVPKDEIDELYLFPQTAQELGELVQTCEFRERP